MSEVTKLHEILSQHEFEHKKILGEGAFSSVHLCHSKKYHHDFAIKQAKKHRLSAQEFQTLISLNHPNVIKIYDAFEDESAQYLVMEYCPQGTIKQKTISSYDKFIYYARQILEAVAYCHSKNIAHRDIKPDNIFLDQYDHIKLADFGLARKFDINERSNEKCGSLMFFSPEMFQYQEIDPFKADIWALGITFYYMATGNYPFQSDSREDLKQLINLGELDYETYDVDPQIRFLINKMTTKNAKIRPTAEKVLKFPMFEQVGTMKTLFLKDKCNGKQLPTGYYTQLSLPIDKATANDATKTAQCDTILSYRGINRYPKIQRITTRPQPKKTSLE